MRKCQNYTVKNEAMLCLYTELELEEHLDSSYNKVVFKHHE